MSFANGRNSTKLNRILIISISTKMEYLYTHLNILRSLQFQEVIICSIKVSFVVIKINIVFDFEIDFGTYQT